MARQRGSWDLMFEVVRDAQSLVRVEYVKVCCGDVEKNIPHLWSVAESADARNVYRVPLAGAGYATDDCIVVRFVYASMALYSLLTAEHLRKDGKKREVSVVNMLAGAPIAYVSSVFPSTGECRFLPPTTSKMMVSGVYSALERSIRTMYCYNHTANDFTVGATLRETLAVLCAPLAFKIIYQQCRFTEYFLNTHPLTDVPWGSRVTWRYDEPHNVCTFATGRPIHEIGNETDVSWCQFTLTESGLEIARGVQTATFGETLTVPYRFVILTAISCGAHELWHERLRDKLSSLAAAHNEFGECQRCGDSYRVNPLGSSVKQTLTVRQIDDALSPRAKCTVLCTTAGSLCLTHKRKHVDDNKTEDQENKLDHEATDLYATVGCSEFANENTDSTKNRTFETESVSCHAYWQGFTCRALGYHSKIIPLGYPAGSLVGTGEQRFG